MAIRKRELVKKDKWFVDLRWNGKRIREHVDGTKKDAMDREKQIIAELVAGTWNFCKKDITFDELVDEYLEYTVTTKAPNTFNTDRCRIEGHLLKHFRGHRIDRITRKMLDQYKQKRIEEGASANTVNHELTNLSHIFKMAIRWEYIDKNIVTANDKLKFQVTSQRSLGEEELEQLAEAAKESHIYPLIMTAMHTGMRKAELFNLKWTDIDFDSQRVTIQPKSDWSTKNYKPRHVPITPALYEVLREHREEVLRREIQNEYVFTYCGRQLKSNIKKSLARIVKNAGLNDEDSKNVTLHVLRHSFCSHLVMAGVPLRDVQELMGHQSYETTLQYAHLSPGHSSQQVNKLPYAKGFGKSWAQIGHRDVISIDKLKRKEPRKVAPSQGS